LELDWRAVQRANIPRETTVGTASAAGDGGAAAGKSGAAKAARANRGRGRAKAEGAERAEEASLKAKSQPHPEVLLHCVSGVLALWSGLQGFD